MFGLKILDSFLILELGAPTGLVVKALQWNSNGLVVKALDSQSGGPMFKTAEWLQGRLNRPSFRGR